MEKITKEEFLQKYAQASGLTVEDLQEFGQVAMPCGCDYDLCQGWQMVNKEYQKHGV